MKQSKHMGDPSGAIRDSRRAASASINWSTGPLGSLAKYFLSNLMTFPSANRASRAAWRARRLALLTLRSSVLVRDLVFSNFNSAAFSLDCTSMALSESPFLFLQRLAVSVDIRNSRAAKDARKQPG